MKKLPFLLSVIILLLNLSLFGAIPASERSALIALYNSTNGDNWTNNTGWKTSPLDADSFAMPGTEGSWHGITVEDNHVIKIEYLDNLLSGTIPVELVNLTYLQNLWLPHNKLTGIIPQELGNLNNLQVLDFSVNQLTGNIPPELGNLINLKTLYLSLNELNGETPSELGNLANLESLSLSDNRLSGTIPTELGNLSNLQSLLLGYNQLTGAIPSELGNLINLKNFGAYNNQLSGSLPSSLGNLVNLEYLSLTNNRLSGTIPNEFGNLISLEKLYLYSNQLTGSIPIELGSLVNLQIIYLSNNQISGPIPEELGNLPNLEYIYLSANQINGTIPASLGNSIKLKVLYLTSNQLIGNIPIELGNLINMTTLALSNNKFSGTLPTELGSLTNLNSIYLSNNNLTGNIPASFTNLINLTQTDIGYNALYTDDNTLNAFLDSKDPDWAETQTIAPNSVNAIPISNIAINVSWDPIVYTANTGGYRVFYSITSGGPYTYYGQTTDKNSTSLSVSGLSSFTTYYFVVKTRTDVHGIQQNILDSEFSTEVSATTFPTQVKISGNITSGGSPLENVVLSGFPGNPTSDSSGNYSVLVPYNWSGTATPNLDGYVFTNLSTTYTNIAANQITNYTAVKTIPSSERTALIALYNSTNGDSWTNNTGWKTAPLHTDGFAMPGTEDNWVGIWVENNHVTIISLGSNHLTGSIPTGLYSLSGLMTMSLQHNQISGIIPSEFGDITNLRYLNLCDNQLTGNIPPELANLTFLGNLDLSSNQLSGTIPSEFGNLTNLQTLKLTACHVSGNIPVSLGNLSNLTHLYLDYNQLIGIIPSELGSLNNLQVLNLQVNQLTGNVPLEIGNLTNLVSIILSNNQLSGSLPPELGSLTKLGFLYIRSNQLTGTIPPELGNLVNLQHLVLSSNQLSGSIPKELCNLINLSSLELDSNMLTGNIHPELGNLIKLDNLYLRFNQLTGSIPKELGNLVNLTSLLLNSNQLTGNIPSELTNLTKLLNLYLYSNHLTGNIPINIGNLTNLQNLYIYSNNLTGEIPTSVIDLVSINNLNIGYNCLSTADSATRAWLDSKDPDWEDHQDQCTYINILSPNGGDIWELGSTHKVTWNSSGLTNNVKLTLWKDEVLLGLIVKDIDPAVESYSWTAGTYLGGMALSGNGYKIKVREQGGIAFATEGISLAFTLIPPQPSSITFNSPSGGENWKLGTSQNISWSASGLKNFVKLTLWRNESFVGLIARDIDPSIGSYTWTAGTHLGGMALSSTGYKIKVREQGGIAFTTECYSLSFTLIPSIIVKSPNGGENWELGSTQNITWNAHGLTNDVKLTLWRNESFVGLIARDIDPSIGSYNWTTGTHSGGMALSETGYKIKVREQGGISFTTEDFSNASFTITAESPDENSAQVAYYPFNGNADDESGNELHGEVYGAELVEDRFGNTESAYIFDGVDDFIKVLHDPLLSFSSDFTISAWVVSDSLLTVNNYVIVKGTELNHEYAFFLSSGLNMPNMSINTSSDNSNIRIDTFLPGDKWVHLVALYQDGIMKIYINGVEMGESVHEPPFKSTSDLFFGGMGNSFYNGKIDDIRIYNRALSKEEILDIYIEEGWDGLSGLNSFDNESEN